VLSKPAGLQPKRSASLSPHARRTSQRRTDIRAGLSPPPPPPPPPVICLRRLAVRRTGLDSPPQNLRIVPAPFPMLSRLARGLFVRACVLCMYLCNNRNTTPIVGAGPFSFDSSA